MPKRKPYDIRKGILMLLREKPLSYTQIQTKMGTNYDSVKNNCEELKDYGLIDVKIIERHPENGKPSFDVHLTERGFDVLKKIRKP